MKDDSPVVYTVHIHIHTRAILEEENGEVFTL